MTYWNVLVPHRPGRSRWLHGALDLSMALLFVLGMACNPQSRATTPTRGAPLPDSATAKYRACSVDSECMYIQNGCCDCGNGGADLAINRKHQAEFLAQLKCGAETPCSMMQRIPACGSGSVQCTAGMCTYTHAAP